jgi:hypothetical protein
VANPFRAQLRKGYAVRLRSRVARARDSIPVASAAAPAMTVIVGDLRDGNREALVRLRHGVVGVHGVPREVPRIRVRLARLGRGRRDVST